MLGEQGSTAHRVVQVTATPELLQLKNIGRLLHLHVLSYVKRELTVQPSSIA
jgi:hypothetical protein